MSLLRWDWRRLVPRPIRGGSARKQRLSILPRVRPDLRPETPTLDTNPYEGARLAGRREIRDEIRQRLAEIYAVTETPDGRDAIWNAIEQLEDLP